MKKEEFIFCPLGGSGEIGMNMNLFAYGNPENRKWIIVDKNITIGGIIEILKKNKKYLN